MTKAQVVPLNIGAKAARFEALLSNKVAAAILDPPYTTMAAKEGYRLLADLAPLDVPYLRNIVAVAEKSLREDPRTVARFVGALADGMQFYRNPANRDETIRILREIPAAPIGKEPRDDRRRLRNLPRDDAEKTVRRSGRNETTFGNYRRV